MLDRGYSLVKLEMLNWGNFHGLQTLNLYEPSDSGFLFAPSPNSAILGINGSGKSTIIDGLMMCLLPFERHLKLGVTNDVENGSSGGRSVKDYVLGKYASVDGTEGGKTDSSFSRRDGCTIFLLSFQHNLKPQSKLTIGRIWWYQNYIVSETSLGFVSYSRLAIKDLCQNSQIPKSSKDFKEIVKKYQSHSIQVFDSANNYFISLSTALGGITKDDLKILNRAFYVKSIAQIDQFIRENMLLEQEGNNLNTLMENVRNGREIAFSIERCKKKIQAIEGILKDIERLKDLQQKNKLSQIRLQLLDMYPDWLSLKNNLAQIEKLDFSLKQIESELPLNQDLLKSAKLELQSLQNLLAQQDIESRVLSLQTEIDFLSEKITWFEKTYQNYLSLCQKVSLKPAVKVSDWAGFLDRCQKDGDKLNAETLVDSETIESYRQDKFNLELQVKTLKQELEHVIQNGCLIPQDIYQIKIDAMKDLKIPEKSIKFVGELIQIKTEFYKNRRAIESVLFAISRNLLCDPKYRDDLTKWLDNKGLKADITVKRITDEELSNDNLELDFSPNQILGQIQVLPKTQHIFTDYLWTWLLNTFDYKLVEVAKFKTSQDKVVTADGLVKMDHRTMRKLKQNFSYSLGWDNSEVIDQYTRQLSQISQSLQKAQDQIISLQKKLQNDEEKLRILSSFKNESSDFLQLEFFNEKIKTLTNEKTKLLKSNPDYQKLKLKMTDLENLVSQYSKQVHLLEDRKITESALIEKIKGLIPNEKKNLYESLVYQSLLQVYSSEVALENKMQEWHLIIQGHNSERSKQVELARLDVNKINSQKDILFGRLGAALNYYQREFSDPNLVYSVSSLDQIQDMDALWSQALNKLQDTELPQAEKTWKDFFEQILMDSVRDTVNEVKQRLHEITQNITSINEVLKLTNFEDLPTEKRYLQIVFASNQDDRVRKFRHQMNEVEKLLGTQVRSLNEGQSEKVIQVLTSFVDDLQKDGSYRDFVTDVRNHFSFKVQSLKRMPLPAADEIAETFTGARKDAKSSAQTTQLAYTLLASCLAYRFRFNDPEAGANTPRLLILDEFGGKFDNEKPKDIIKLLDQMGFQSILVSPMSKAELLSGSINHLVLVHKESPSVSKAHSVRIHSKEDYDQLIRSAKSSREKMETKTRNATEVN